MSNCRFRRGIHIKFRGREYVIEHRLRNSEFQIKDTATNEFRAIHETKLIDALFDGHLRFLSEDVGRSYKQGRIIKSLVDDMSMMNDDDLRKKEAKRRYAYVKEIIISNLIKYTEQTLVPLINKIAERSCDFNPPHWKTVYYFWYLPFEISGRDIRVLIPAYKSRGNSCSKFIGKYKSKGDKYSIKEKAKAKEVAEIIKDVIDEVYLNEQRLSIQDVCDALETRIAGINKFRDVSDQLPNPHKSSVYDIVNKLDEYEKDRARYGRKYADHKHRCNKRGPRPTRPLERVEIDHTTLDLFVLDNEVRLPVGRPTITVLIDRYSRMILGIYVSFERPGYSSVMQCLLHAIKPKNYLKTQFPYIENEWGTYGIPELIVVDNALEFYCKDFEDACLQIGADVLYSPVKVPHYKAAIERYFGTLNRRLLHKQPGTTFSNIFERKDYDPKKNALISFNEFMKILHIWIVDIYHQSIHRGLKDIPARVWKESISKYRPALRQRHEDLRILIGHVEHRTIGPSGIELSTLFYNCEELALLRRETKGQKVPIKLDLDDISMVYVYDRKNDKYIPCPAMDQEYTKGLRLWQHIVIKNYARQFVKDHVNIEALRRAKKKIQEIVDKEWIKPHKSGVRSKIARWNGIRQQNYDAVLPIHAQEAENVITLTNSKETLLLNPKSSPWAGISDIATSARYRTQNRTFPTHNF